MIAHQRALLLRLEAQVRKYARLRAGYDAFRDNSAVFYMQQATRWEKIEVTLKELEAYVPD